MCVLSVDGCVEHACVCVCVVHMSEWMHVCCVCVVSGWVC